MGGAVVGIRENPTLAVLKDNHGDRGRKTCQDLLTHLLPTNRIVRERWLHRLEGLAEGAELPDTRPDAVYALVSDLRNPTSYWYDEENANPFANPGTWTLVRADWTSAQAGGAG